MKYSKSLKNSANAESKIDTGIFWYTPWYAQILLSSFIAGDLYRPPWLSLNITHCKKIPFRLSNVSYSDESLRIRFLEQRNYVFAFFYY